MFPSTKSTVLAANLTSIDYFSIDVEGIELEVLKTIPWNKVDIKVRTLLFHKGLFKTMIDKQ
jgi:hypothetical protein